MKQFGKEYDARDHGGLQFAEATATMIGSVIGAGILGIPFAIAKVGFFPGVVMLLILAVVTIILELMFAEVTLRTKNDHEIPGYGGLYLGFRAKALALLVGIVGGYGTLLAYMIAQGEILQALFSGSPALWSLAFFAAGSYVIYRGLEAVRVIELVMTIGIFAIMFLIGLTAHPHIDSLNFVHYNLTQLIVPYGVLVFALSGITVVPQVRKQMRGSEKKLPAVILVANVAVVTAYLLFMWLTLGVTGAETTEVATIGLGEKIGPTMLILGNSLAFFTISTSFITVGLSIRRLFQYDYNFTRFKAWLSTIMIPLVVFLFGARSFIQVVGIVGGVIMGVQSAIIVFAYWKAQDHGGSERRKPEFKLGPLFVVGLILLCIYFAGAALTVLDAV